MWPRCKIATDPVAAFGFHVNLFKSVTSSACQTDTASLFAPCGASHRCINERMLLVSVTFSGGPTEISMPQETDFKLMFESLQVEIE